MTPLRQGIDTSAPCTGKEGAMRFMMRTQVLALLWLFGACSEGTPVDGADAEGSAGAQPDVVAVFTPEDGSASEPTDVVGGADDADDRGDGPETDALDAPDAVEASEGQCVTLECDDAGACEAVLKADGEPCDAPCFEAASCQAGECTPEPGSALSCAPSNTACVSAFECDHATGACTLPVYAPAGSACDTDDDVCSLERCDGGGACDFQGIETCAQARAENPCWEWSCKGKAGCVEALFDEGALCDDGNPCTGDDTCTKTGQGQEVCLGAPVDTDDDDPCTEDACVDGEVVHTPIPGCADSPCPGGCDDGDPCTSDACVEDACENLPIEGCIAECPSDCDDGNPCTDDACEDGVCVNSPNTAPCSDNDPCTASDQCAAGACVSGEPVGCDDADPCTVDSCLSALGCQHIADASLEGCGTACTPYAIEPCYTGPVGSAGVGRCRAGFRVCHQSGEAWSHCTHEVLPLGGELCANGVDDTCDGSQDGAGCNSAGVWVDGVMGSDTTGDGSFDKPWATIEQGLEGGPELVLIKSGDMPTVYPEGDLELGPQHSGIRVVGVGPTRPVIIGSLEIEYCEGCHFERLALQYPADDAPPGLIDAAHSARNIFRDIHFSAPDGLPKGKSLVDGQHAYDNEFIDIEIDDVVLSTEDTSSVHWELLDLETQGSGSAFIRVRLGQVSFSGGEVATMTLTLISARGECGETTTGVTQARSCLVTGVDMSGWATSARFEGFDFGCDTDIAAASGLLLANNTLADLSADRVTFAELSLGTEIQTWVTSNIIGPFSGDETKGLDANLTAVLRHSNVFGVKEPVDGSAALGGGVLTSDPEFVGAAAGDYQLAPSSPCVGSGELANIDGSAGDMGAYGGPLALTD